MKKILYLIGLVLLIQHAFAKHIPVGSYYNYSQNIGGGGWWSVNNFVMAEIGDSVILSAFVIDLDAGGGGAYLYPSHWYFNGDTIPNTMGQESLSIIINQFGTYSASIITDINFYVSNTTGIPSIKNINFLNIFPTAVNSSITIQLNSTKPDDVEISFYDINGKQLKNDFYKNISGEFIKNENTEALAKGIYFIRIKAGDEMVNKKFIKM